MIVPDVNLLVHAHDSRSRRHEAARKWWEELMNGTGTVGLPWAAILGFIRIATNPKILDNPLDVGGACTRVRSWLARPQTALIHPGDRHADILFGLLDEAGSAGNLTTTRILPPSRSSTRRNFIRPMPTWPGFVGCAGRILSSDRQLPRCPSPASRLVEPENAGIAPPGQGVGVLQSFALGQ